MSEISLMKQIRSFLEDKYGEEFIESYGNEIYVNEEDTNNGYKVTIETIA